MYIYIYIYTCVSSEQLYIEYLELLLLALSPFLITLKWFLLSGESISSYFLQYGLTQVLLDYAIASDKIRHARCYRLQVERCKYMSIVF